MDESTGSGSVHSAVSEELLQSFVPHPYQSLNADGDILAVNDAWIDLLGYEREDVIGRWFGEILTEDSRTKFESRFDDFKSSGGVSDVEFEIRCNDSSTVIVSFDGVVEYDHRGNFVQIHCQFADITERKDREAELQRDCARLNALFQHSTDAVVFTEFVDGDPIVREVNAAFEKTFGYDEESAVGRPIDELVVPDESDKLQEDEALNRRPGAGERVLTEVRRQTVDGVKDFLLQSIPLEPGESGTPTYAIYNDITERKEREQELSRLKRRYETLIEAAPDPVFIADTETGDLLEANSAAEELLGTTRENIVGRKYTAIAPAEDAELYQEVFERAQKESETITRLSDGSRPQLLTAEGETVPVEFSTGVASVADEEVVIGIFRDISERVARDQEIQDRNERLETFAKVVSHDLRNPLNVASGRLGLAMEECDSENLTKIEEAHDRMELLIRDLLVLAQQGESVGEYEVVALSELCHDCRAGVNAEGTSIDIDIDRTIRADASRLKQIFENLFRNAAEHGGDNVTVTVGELDGGFYVEDDGEGISDAEVGDVFQVGHSTKEDGTGFGLSIVKEIVEAHNWDIRVTEGIDEGARFEITGVEFVAE